MHLYSYSTAQHYADFVCPRNISRYQARQHSLLDYCNRLVGHGFRLGTLRTSQNVPSDCLFPKIYSMFRNESIRRRGSTAGWTCVPSWGDLSPHILAQQKALSQLFALAAKCGFRFPRLPYSARVRGCAQNPNHWGKSVYLPIIRSLGRANIIQRDLNRRELRVR
jgi:hypothetical protein